MSSHHQISFLKYALQKQGYRWTGFKKPKAQVLKRVRKRIHELGLSGGFSEYKEYLESNPEEWENFDALCDVTISRFFRDRELWDHLRFVGLRAFKKRSEQEKFRIWSVGCCNGEEPFSIAILFDMVYGEMESEAVDILATDRNGDVLARAKKGRYPAGALREMKKCEIEKYFDKNSSDEFHLIDRLKKYVVFEKRDIRYSLPNGKFDMIFCRNLAFTYFSEKTQFNFLNKISEIIKKEGVLIIGKGESLPNHDLFEKAHPKFPVFKKITDDE